MRTTLTIDDSLASELRKRALEPGAAQVIVVDANLLIYAVNQDLPQHKQARAWWEQMLSGTARIGIPWVSIMAFLRICTNPRIFSLPLPPEAALAYIDD